MRQSISVLCLSATALILLSAGAMAQQKTLKEQIQGPWQLASCNSTTEKGEKVTYCANNPTGILILAGNGHYSLTTMAGARKEAVAADVAANFGTWSVDEASKTLTLHRDTALFPANNGKDIKTNISLSGEELHSTGSGDGGAHLDVTYRRFK